MLKISYTSRIMNRMMTPWMQSLHQMCDVLALLLFVLVFFSAVGLYTFKGDYYDRCRTTPAPVGDVWPAKEGIARFCSVNGNGDFDCPAGSYCGSPDTHGLPLEGENISELAEAFYGTLSFDDGWKAFLLDFQVITFDSWADVMYKAQDSNNTYVARIFFPLLVFIGAFFCLNLTIAVVFETFQEVREQLNEKNSPDPQTLVRSRTIETPTSDALRSAHTITLFSRRMTTEPGKEDDEDGLNWFCRLCRNIRRSAIYTSTVLALVVGSLLVIALDRKEISDFEYDLIDTLDTVFFALFLLEMIINLGAKGPRGYVRSPSCMLDLIINVLGVVEVALAHSRYTDSMLLARGYNTAVDWTARGVIVVFRTMRALKLAGKWPALRNMLAFFWHTREDIVNFAVLVCLFVFMFAIIGMELFAHEVKFNSKNEKDLDTGESSRINFDDIGHAMLSSFSLQIGDNWATYYVLYMRYSHLKGTFYFILGVVVLNILLFNLFVGILLENFFSDDQKQAITEEEKRDREFQELQRRLGKPKNRYKNRSKTLLTALKAFRAILSHAFSVRANSQAQHPENELSGSSLMIFGTASRVRLFLAHVVKHSAFPVVCYIMTAINSVVLTFYTPQLDPDSASYRAALVLDVTTTVFFCIEATMKSVAFGFALNGPGSYLRSPLNVIDFIATVVAVLTFIFDFSPTAAHRLFLLFRILRALRFLDICEGFRTRVRALVYGAGRILQMLFITALFIVVFAVIGTHFFKGMLYYCDKSNGDISVSTVYDCMNLGGEWRSRDIGFDNVLMASMTLFELFSGKSWCNTISFLPDLVAVDIEPVRDTSTRNVWFAVIYMFIVFLFVRAVLTGVISNTFFVNNEKLQGLHELTNAQRRWVSLSKIIFKASPIKEYDPKCPLYGLYRILIHPVFAHFILLTILLNGVMLFLSWHRAPHNLVTSTGRL